MFLKICKTVSFLFFNNISHHLNEVSCITKIISYSNAVSEIVGLASQFATQNCLGCYSKLNLGNKLHAEVATHFPHIKLSTLYTLNTIL